MGRRSGAAAFAPGLPTVIMVGRERLTMDPFCDPAIVMAEGHVPAHGATTVLRPNATAVGAAGSAGAGAP